MPSTGSLPLTVSSLCGWRTLCGKWSERRGLARVPRRADAEAGVHVLREGALAEVERALVLLAWVGFQRRPSRKRHAEKAPNDATAPCAATARHSAVVPARWWPPTNATDRVSSSLCHSEAGRSSLDVPRHRGITRDAARNRFFSPSTKNSQP